MLRSMSLNMDEGLSFQEIGGQNLRDRLELPLPHWSSCESAKFKEDSFNIRQSYLCSLPITYESFCTFHFSQKVYTGNFLTIHLVFLFI
jgi:hypothetical protein